MDIMLVSIGLLFIIIMVLIMLLLILWLFNILLEIYDDTKSSWRSFKWKNYRGR